MISQVKEISVTRDNAAEPNPAILPSTPGERHGNAAVTSRAAGFTLLEVIIAMAVLAVALVAVFQSQSQSVAMLNRSRFETTASLLAKSRMAELEVTISSLLRSDRGGFGDDFPDYSWEVNVEGTPLSGLVKMTVVVTNDRMKRHNTYRLELYRIVSSQ
ncbi:MAG: hypothetical protein AVO39_03700 [delta proteobacterium MLS_D]|jgi:general secretion pathway protein I|nr:MAG: hypothetical protein AVO39_03700 [delta proteobacterium MLS_D]